MGWKYSGPLTGRFFSVVHTTVLDFPGGSDGKESTCNAGDPDLIPGLGGSPGEGNGNTLQYFCLEKSHRQRSLMGYSPWGCKESDMTERLTRVRTTVSAEVGWIQGCGTMDAQEEPGVRRADCGYVWWGRAPSPVLFKGQLCFYLQPHSWVVQWPGLLQPQYPECPADFRHLRTIFRGGLEEEESLSPEGPCALSQLWSRGPLKTEYMTANICASGTFPGCLHYR